MRLAHLDGEIVTARQLRDWPTLTEAAQQKVAEISAFVGNWDERVRAAGHQPKNANGHYLSVGEAFDAWGIAQPTVSRWRAALQDADAFLERIMLGAYRKAGLEREENHRAEGTGENEWFTPAEYIAAAREVMGGIVTWAARIPGNA